MSVAAEISRDLLIRARESCEQVQQALDSDSVHLGLCRVRQNGYMLPSWIQDHLMVWKQLERSVLNEFDRDRTVSDETLDLLNRCHDLTNEFVDEIDPSLFLRAINSSKQSLDPSGLLQSSNTTDTPIPSVSTEWNLNMGLLINLYRRTDNPELKAKINFMIINYLSKATPILYSKLPPEEQKELDKHNTQLGIIYNSSIYNREDGDFRSQFNNSLSQISQSCPNQFLLSDLDIQSSLSVLYAFIPYTGDQSLDEDISAQMNTYLEKILLKGDKIDFENRMSHPILIDFTSCLSTCILTDQDSGREEILSLKLEEINQKLEEITDKIIKKISYTHPDLVKSDVDREKLKIFIKLQIGAVCRVSIDGVSTLVQIPLFPSKTPKDTTEESLLKRVQADTEGLELSSSLTSHTLTTYERLDNFMTLSGLRIGNLEGRIKIAESVPLESSVEYAIKGKSPQHFPKRLDLINRKSFTRLESRFSDEELKHRNPQTYILGNATLKLLKGFLGEVTDDKWEELNRNPETRVLLQTLLYRIAINLGNAENHIADFTKFDQDIELIHCDLLNLLYLVMPFAPDAFNDIYKNQLTSIPEALRKTTSTGLHKSGMNNFFWVLNKLQSKNPERRLNMAYGLDSYYQSIAILGEQNTADKVAQDPSIATVDLYLGEFNHNISTDETKKCYEPGKIIEDVEKILKAKPAIEHMTVAIDCTIDTISSPQVQDVLNHFQKEIAEGKLNFVFFKSGQKFDMFGLDNYYGAPIYAVNNGDSYWASFANIGHDKGYQTDPISQQWFSLAYKYAPDMLDSYRNQLFANTRRVLDNVPPILKATSHSDIVITEVSPLMKPCFIDMKIKMGGKLYPPDCEEIIIRKLKEKGCKYHFSRASFGFIHTDFGQIPSDIQSEYCTYRITPGLDPKESDALIEALQEIAVRSAS